MPETEMPRQICMCEKYSVAWKCLQHDLIKVEQTYRGNRMPLREKHEMIKSKKKKKKKTKRMKEKGCIVVTLTKLVIHCIRCFGKRFLHSIWSWNCVSSCNWKISYKGLCLVVEFVTCEREERKKIFRFRSLVNHLVRLLCLPCSLLHASPNAHANHLTDRDVDKDTQIGMSEKVNTTHMTALVASVFFTRSHFSKERNNNKIAGL